MTALPSERDTCRICGSPALREVLDLGNLAVSDFVADADPVHAPLVLVLCDPDEGGCAFVQLKHRVLDQALLYTRYWYRSGTNESMRAALADIVREAQTAVQLRAGDIVVDIGANDGTLLRAYGRGDLRLVGFEPAENLLTEARTGTNLIIPELFSAATFKRHLGAAARAQLITSIAMFYDLEEPHEFVQEVAEILAPDGLWIVQMAYLPTMLDTNNFDNICHEHVGYYSLAVMDRLVRAHGLEIRDVELNDVNGGSFRIYLQHEDHADARWRSNGADERVARLAQAERAQRLTETDKYRWFADRMRDIKETVRNFILQELANGKVFHVYGASTKGNTILQYFGLDHRHFQLAADRNSDKWGLRTVLTNIPIVSEEVSRAARPDYYFVLPWHFRETFLTREQAFLGSGGGMIFPLPEPLLVHMTGGELRESVLGAASARTSSLSREDMHRG
ncbi:MAG TPA: class I SAM-dependent methyltransferase [Mycobacteriales bacterium]|nr:class I SAM-dependent methyltransferase [Mycobacteriales bacterium]